MHFSLVPRPFKNASFSDYWSKHQMPRPLESNSEWPSQGDPNHAQVHPSSKNQGSEEQTAGSGQG